MKIIEDKNKYKEQIARVKALPEDYQYVFEKIQHYMWMFTDGDGMEIHQKLGKGKNNG
ncbi:MAG: DUF1048 domain-containing protein [Lachnoclostridium sp.]|nr:DUF1048 domain-containing protein [Lachnoclostridium sp.]